MIKKARKATAGSFKKGHKSYVLSGEKNHAWKGGVSFNIKHKKEINKKWFKEHPNYSKEQYKKWAKNNPNYEKEYGLKRKEYRKRIRKSVIEALGGKCVRCDFNDERALQIDHVNGDGCKDRKNGNNGVQFQRKVIESFLKGENKYQLLCANCNWIKRSENNEIRKSFY